MAKIKPAGGKKKLARGDAKGLISCGFLILVGLGLLFWMMWAVMSSGK